MLFRNIMLILQQKQITSTYIYLIQKYQMKILK